MTGHRTREIVSWREEGRGVEGRCPEISRKERKLAAQRWEASRDGEGGGGGVWSHLQVSGQSGVDPGRLRHHGIDDNVREGGGEGHTREEEGGAWEGDSWQQRKGPPAQHA